MQKIMQVAKSKSKRKRIGLYGGTFDPVHNGHIEVALAALHSAELDEVWLVVAADPPHKQSVVASQEDRLAMARLAIKDRPGLKVTDIELHLPHPSYTLTTIQELKRQHPEIDFHLIIGLDTLPLLPTWHRWQELLREVPMWIAPREGYSWQQLGDLPNLLSTEQLEELLSHRIDMPAQACSSTQVRQQLSVTGKCELLTSTVQWYIEEKGLYGVSLEQAR